MRPGGKSQIMNLELFDRIMVGNTLGEGVIWDHRTETIWWTDIQESRLYHYNLSSKKLGYYETPERLCSFGFTDDEEWFIVAFENGFAKYNPEKNIINWLSKPQEHHNQIRFNDGRVDRQGRFWSGTMVEDNNGGNVRGCLYRLDMADKKLAVPLLEDILISNSLCWSPDSKKMYFADSTNNRIDVYDFDAALGMPTNGNPFATTNEDIFPDGSTIDQEGFLWNAQWGGSRVVRYAPYGEIDFILEVPVSQPTCVAFGGSDLSWLFVTTAKDGLDNNQLANEEFAGDLLIYKTDIKGIPENIIKMRNVK